MGKNKIGIYFGRDYVSVIEVSGERIINQARLPLTPAGIGIKGQDKPTAAAAGAIPEVSLMQGLLKDNKIEARKAYLGLSNRDQFIRSFQTLLLSKTEMDTGIQFEAKKYVPFRIEDLAYDYQYRIDKKAAKMDILFVAATLVSLDSCVNTLVQAGLKVAAISPSSLALARLLLLTKQFDPKISFALLTVQNTEAEFTIIDRGFPYFSREIKLSETLGVLDISSVDPALLKGALVSEIRISLDYFRRQFSGSSIAKIMFLSKDIPGQEALIAGLNEDLGLEVEGVDLKKNGEAAKIEDLDMLKAYALALKDSCKINLTVDLNRRKYAQPILAEAEKPAALNIRVIFRPLMLALALAGAVFIPTKIELDKLQQQIGGLRVEFEALVPPKLAGLPLDGLREKKSDYAAKLAALDALVSSRRTITPFWNILPAAVNKGLWLEDVDFQLKEGKLSLHIKGAVYLGEQSEEINAVRDFFQKLKDNPDFMKGLVNVELSSVSQAMVKEYMVTTFEISGG